MGAPQIRLRSMVQELTRRGYRVEVVTAMPNYPTGRVQPGYKGKFYVRETRDDVLIKRTWIYAATGKGVVQRLANYLSFTVTALPAVLFSPRPDVLFVESQPLSLGLIAVLMKWVRGIPFIYNVPDLQVDVARQVGFLRNQFVLSMAFRLENFFLHQSWKVSTVTYGFVDHFIGRGLDRSKVTFLPNGADTEFLKPKEPNHMLLDRWELHGKKVFLYVGTHAYYHGLDTLIDAAALLSDRSDIAFLLVGDGPERKRLIAKAKDLNLRNIKFGTSPYEEMRDLYSIAYASVAVLRDLEVSKGMRLSKVFPSLSCAVPVVYSGSGEAANLLESESCGVVVPPEDARALANALAGLAADAAARDRMGVAGRSFTEREHSWRVIVARWLDNFNR